ncbi:hypothetical protein KC851_01150 [Candidatus Kaiserbacteria bacterium]|nr:hypothetical protein [Candidatus Kaiserbacteria bacterium]
MNTNGNNRSLESYKIFPYLAWVVTIGFSFFVYNITLDLKAVTIELQAQTEMLQQQISLTPNITEGTE